MKKTVCNKVYRNKKDTRCYNLLPQWRETDGIRRDDVIGFHIPYYDCILDTYHSKINYSSLQFLMSKINKQSKVFDEIKWNIASLAGVQKNLILL